MLAHQVSPKQPYPNSLRLHLTIVRFATRHFGSIPTLLAGCDMIDKAIRIEQYRKKAKEVSLIAESIKDAEARRTLMTVAGDYLVLADLLERSLMEDPLSASE